ncbi:MAG: sigma 54-interacting transcriptional regulator [Deltaproteobacteria bacterium]|nr:sigma 54-interacting transcriptional regulator [Deltaproteobacteria bacterium]
MKRKITIALGIYFLIFFLGGLYIITTIEDSTSRLHHLIRLYQVEILRERLLIRIKDVQSDLSRRRTSHSKDIDTVIENVRSLDRISSDCFQCHHPESVISGLNVLRSEIRKYKALISRTLTIRANRHRLEQEDEMAFKSADRISKKINRMVRAAADKLSLRTQSSLNDISNTKLVLYVLVGMTPFFAAGLGLIFIRGLTKPVNVLLNATRKLKGGNLTHRIERLPDEFGEVAASFNEMAARMQEYTQRLEKNAIELDRAHRQTRSSFAIIQEIGTQSSLREISYYLMGKFAEIIPCTKMVLLVFSSNDETLFAFSEKDTYYFEKKAVEPDMELLKGPDRIAFKEKSAFKSSIISENIPSGKRLAVFPFYHEHQHLGSLVIGCPANCRCDRKALEVIALILNQTSGAIKRMCLHEEEIRDLQCRIEHKTEFSGIVGKDPQMQTIYKMIEDIAPTDATVLIQGESGTGKELVARAIHQRSLRKEKPFVVINCSAYPATLLESELFGHERGAFTGAIRQKMGRFEQAHGGTIFLDEIGEINPSAQIKLLRVLQTQKFERVGVEQTLHVNVRILSASNKDLLQEVKSSRFREDLFYRLNVIQIQLPPLRKRRGDIPLLARYFLERFNQNMKKQVKGFSTEAMRRLLDYHWPGNVRELENSVEHSVLLTKGDLIGVQDLPTSLFRPDIPINHRSGRTIIENEAKLLKEVLDECGWNKKTAARRLGISRSTLYKKLKKYQIQPTLH